MSGELPLFLHVLGLAAGAAAAAYALLCLTAVLRWNRRQRRLSVSGIRRAQPQTQSPGEAPLAVTVLKPLCGAEPRLYESLRSLCEQRAGGFQIVFGVRDGADPAVSVVRRLQHEYPRLDLALSIDGTVHGSNLKVSNLINMMRLARHDMLVLADSDVQVDPDYLVRVTAPLANPAVGIVTCPYRGRPEQGPWSLLLAAFINDWFMPSVLVAVQFGSRAFAFGATIAMRRSVLEAIGGFEGIADQLADDYRLGELTRKAGLQTVLSDVVVETWVNEASARDLVRHELRWLRTIRAVRPGGYASSIVTFALPLAALGWVVSGRVPGTLVLLAVTAAARLLLHFTVRRARAALLQLWVLPINDMLAFTLWCSGFLSRSVHWRQARYRVARDGSARPRT